MHGNYLKTSLLCLIVLFWSCRADDLDEKCYDSKKAAVDTFLLYGHSQSIRQIATGQTSFNILNDSKDLVFKVTKIGISVQPVLVGSRATRFRNTQILLNPGERHQGTYNIDIGDKVSGAYPLMDNITITCADLKIQKHDNR